MSSLGAKRYLLLGSSLAEYTHCFNYRSTEWIYGIRSKTGLKSMFVFF